MLMLLLEAEPRLCAGLFSNAHAAERLVPQAAPHSQNRHSFW